MGNAERIGGIIVVTLLRCGGSGYVVDKEGCYHEYICDSDADIGDLPTGENVKYSPDADFLKKKPRPGSTAVVASDGSVYMLSNSRTWGILIEGNDG